MSEDLAMTNFTHNTLRGMGTGGGAASGSGFQSHLADNNFSIESLQKKFTAPDVFSHTLGKLFDGMQGQAASLSPANIFGGLQPPVTPIGAGAKVPHAMGKGA